MKKWLWLIALMSLSSWADEDSQNQPMGQLETRDHLIVMVMGPDEPLYTISNKEGEVLVSQRTGTQIQTENVDLYRLVQELLANQHGRGASYIDAGSEPAASWNPDSN
ncbi:MAG: hypothetical protein QGI68_02650 [Pseudomonadales bacterium]|nr:hypothetical protein [Pseudomonadales bacterium]HJN50578.1 hypothetical protein [Pseudomonadales bacterium]